MSEASPGTAAQRLAELGIQLNPAIPYQLDSMFAKLDGWGAKGEIKSKAKLINQVEPQLARMLHPDEQVLYIAKGVQYKFSEQYFLGIWAALINQTVFVLTNLRLLMLNTNTKGKPKHTFWMIYYSQIKKFEGGWTGRVSLRLNDGLKLLFTGFAGTDRKQMPAIFEQTLETYRQHGFDPQVSQSRENLCSNCLAVVPKGQYTCSGCGQEFWKPSEVALRSLVFPSWGDFSMGHTGLATVELLGYIVSWIVLVGIFVAGDVGGGGAKIALAVFFLILLAVEHVSDAWLTYFIAKKGLVPKKGPPSAGPTELAPHAPQQGNPPV